MKMKSFLIRGKEAMNKKVITGMLLALIFTGACTDDFGRINTDPTRTTEIPPEMLFTRALVFGALRYDVYQRGKDLYGNRYSQYLANIQPGWGTDRYETRQDWLTAFWRASYSDFGINIQRAIELTAENPDMANLNAQARIWRVFTMHRVTDFWGDVPYMNAQQGNLRPAYDSQEDIYRHMLDELKAAVDQLDEGNPVRTGPADVLFNDDLNQWRRFANSLRLRLAMRVSYADPQLAQNHVSEVLNEGLIMTNNNHSAMLQMDPGGGTGDLVHENPMYWIFRFDEYRISETLMDMLLEKEDPRLPVFARRSGRGTWAGLPNGLSDSQLGDRAYSPRNFSIHGRYFVDQETPIPFIIYPEVKFLEAEAALRGWGPGSAQDHYEDGIRASMAFLNHGHREVLGETEDVISQDDINDYLNHPDVAFKSGGGFEEQLEQIITQKWLAIFGQGLEAWAEIRRTGYPILNEIMAPGGGETDGQLPRRVRYPTEEQGLNPDNLRDAVERQGGNPGNFELHPTRRMWWDANPNVTVNEM